MYQTQNLDLFKENMLLKGMYEKVLILNIHKFYLRQHLRHKESVNGVKFASCQ